MNTYKMVGVNILETNSSKKFVEGCRNLDQNHGPQGLAHGLRYFTDLRSILNVVCIEDHSRSYMNIQISVDGVEVREQDHK